jgi:hypothetical protein
MYIHDALGRYNGSKTLAAEFILAGIRRNVIFLLVL